MARKDEAVDWLKKGYSPSKIAKQMGVTVSTVKEYLYNQVGHGKISRSDIVFSIDSDIRDAIEDAILKTASTYWFKIWQSLNNSGMQVDQYDLKIYLELRDARVVLGEIYEIVSKIEVDLHSKVKRVLTSEYGDGWWGGGIPENIRKECAAAMDRDPEPASEAYCYTYLRHLKEILDKQWVIFAKYFPKGLCSDRENLLLTLKRLNQIRNAVMHPVRGANITDKDFAFIRECRNYLELETWP